MIKRLIQQALKEVVKKLVKTTIRKLIKKRSNHMEKHIKHRAITSYKQLRGFTKKVIARVRGWAKKAWAAHREQVNANTAYVTALAAAVCAAVELVTQDRALLAVVAAVVAVYVAMHHATTPSPWRPSSSRWDDEGYDWR